MVASSSLQHIVFCVAVGGGRAWIQCGDSAGPTCSSAFSGAKCDSKDGACCHDDFNAWCCPHGFKCNNDFHDPGHNNHCMSFEHVTSSCLCEQTDYEIVAFDPVGDAKVESTWDSSLKACCEYPTEQCGWTAAFTKNDQQTVSWSNTAEVGFHMTWSAEPVPGLKLGEIGFEVKDSFTYGQTHTTSQSETYSNGCQCDADHCKGPFTNITFKLKLVESVQSVKIQARKCGVTKTLQGTVKTQQFMGSSECEIGNVPNCNGADEANSLTLVV